MAAAYRNTYAVTADDPRWPLGEEPPGESLRARSWRELIGQWTPLGPATAADSTSTVGTEESFTLGPLHAGIGLDEMLAALAAAE
jgi:hypothetical protein